MDKWPWIVGIKNEFGYIQYYGPFTTQDDAGAWAERAITHKENQLTFKQLRPSNSRPLFEPI